MRDGRKYGRRQEVRDRGTISGAIVRGAIRNRKVESLEILKFRSHAIMFRMWLTTMLQHRYVIMIGASVKKKFKHM